MPTSKKKIGLCQVNANLANDCHEQQWILPFILPSSTSAKMCNDVINDDVLLKMAARVCFHIKGNNKDVGDSNRINTFNPNFPRRGSVPSTSSNTPQWLIIMCSYSNISLLSLHTECRIFCEGVKDEQPKQEIYNNAKDDNTATIKWQLISLVGHTGLVDLTGLVGHNGLVGCTNVGLIDLIIGIIGLVGPIDCIRLNDHIRCSGCNMASP
jgi:hypothetical protein